MQTTQQGELASGRVIVIATGSNGSPPANNDVDPTFVMSPNTPTGLKTTGLLFMLEQPSSGSATAPFDVTVWIRNPVTGFWGSGETLEGVLYGEAYVTFDFDAAELYFQILPTGGEGDNGNVYLHVMEQ